MPETFDLIVRGGEVVNHAGRGLADVGVRAGKIVEIGDLSQASAGQVFDAKGLTVLPGVTAAMVRVRSRTVAMSLPSTDLITSPDCTPAFWAALFGSTCATRAPFEEPSDRLLAISSVTGWIWTPSRPRSTRPLCSSCATIGCASEAGMAKPRPMLPPVGEKIARPAVARFVDQSGKAGAFLGQPAVERTLGQGELPRGFAGADEMLAPAAQQQRQPAGDRRVALRPAEQAVATQAVETR